ncbi:4954_t:CDS:2, partial [Scutellospora calospora]
LIPILLSSKSLFTLTSLQSKSPKCRSIPSTSFWIGYKQNCLENSEILEKIFIPCSTKDQYVRTYQQSKRRYGARAIVNAGLSVLLDNDAHVQEAGFAFGGINEVVVRAPKAENFILGKKWGDEDVLKQLLEILCEEFKLSFSAQ